MRRPAGETTVVGSLLGSVDGQIVEIQTSFSVPLENSSEKEIILDKEYLHKMLNFHRKINPKEDLIGLYISG